MKKQTIDMIQQFIADVFEARQDPQYRGDYSVTITAEGKSLCLAMNGMDADLISDDEVLIHFNVINQEEN